MPEIKHWVWLAAVVLFPLSACTAPPDTNGIADAVVEAHAAPSHPQLRAQILEMVARDQAVRQEWIDVGIEDADPELLMRVMMTDLENTAAMKRIVEEHGWPGPDMIGSDGVKAAFLLVQHADQDPAFQKNMLPHLRMAFDQGIASGEEVALLTDRVLTGMGKPQLYGTQADIVDGKVVVKPVQDEGGLDQRRAELGLMPMDQYLEMMNQVYQLESPPD